MDPGHLETLLDQYSQGCAAPDNLSFRYQHAMFALLAEILAILKAGTTTVAASTTEPAVTDEEKS